MIAADAIALAPFDNLSGNPGEDHLALGFVEDLATELSRFGTLEVLYPRTVEAFMLARGSNAGALKATHILRGSVRRVGNVIRVGVQLVDLSSGRQLWATRYDATATELLAVQDEIAARVAGTLALQVDKVGLAGARRRRPLRVGRCGCRVCRLD